MGITISGPTKSIDLGNAGFLRLRLKVAELSEPDIYEHYKYLCENMFGMSHDDFVLYDHKTEEISAKYNGKKDDILDFLYSPDDSAELSVNVCESVFETIKDYDDNILYGYAGRKDCAKFKDFKDILVDCISHNTGLEWF